MSLRSRLAISFAAFAATAVLVVAITGYITTARALKFEIDRTLVGYSERLENPDGGFITALCGIRVTDAETHAGPIPELPGSRVQCIDSAGSRVVSATSGALPLSRSDRLIARSGGVSKFSIFSTDEGAYRVLTVAVPGGGAVQIARSLAEVERALETLRLRSAILGFFVIVTGGLVGWLIAVFITRPLADLTATAEQIAQTGDLTTAIRTQGNDEVGRLGMAFGVMISALRQSRREQQQLGQDAGHELRTPLTSLRANIDTLSRHPNLDSETRSRVVEDLNSEARELTALTEELLNLVTDQQDYEATQVCDLAELLERAVDRASRRSDHVYSLTAAPFPMEAREGRVLRAVGNLLENAAKFSPNGSPIEIFESGGVITVRDHGVGFTPSDIPMVFRRFYRSDSARALPGSGLGLAIVAQVAAEYGGEVAAQNAEGGGALMTLILKDRRVSDGASTGGVGGR